MISKLVISVLHLAGSAVGSGAVAQSTGGSVNQPVSVGFSLGSLALCVLMLLVLVACVMTAFRIYVAIRGGKIAQGWLLFVVGFGLLGLAQLILLAAQMSVLPASMVWPDTLRAIALITLLVGAGRLRKLLT